MKVTTLRIITTICLLFLSFSFASCQGKEDDIETLKNRIKELEAQIEDQNQIIVDLRIQIDKSNNGPIGQVYTTKREVYDWFTSLNQIRTSTTEDNPCNVIVQLALGYNKGDETAQKELLNRRNEITDMLSKFFSEQTSMDLKPQNEELLRQTIRDRINDEILQDSSIRDVRFTTLDVVQK
ncbi:MAG: flagellar basal body-associated FliL family protein [Treponema sp.]|nr:flagellar basal body-associated FliL family protein [Treponema sp.]